MPYIGFRAPQSVKDAIEKVMEESGRSKSEVIRTALENYLVDYITSNEMDWKIVAWTFLGVDTHKTSHAISRANNAEEFFSYLSRWIKNYDLQLIPDDDNVVILLKGAESQVKSSCPKTEPKEIIVKNIINDLEEQYTDLMAFNI